MQVSEMTVSDANFLHSIHSMDIAKLVKKDEVSQDECSSIYLPRGDRRNFA